MGRILNFPIEPFVGFDVKPLEWEAEVNRGSQEYIRWVQQALNQIMRLQLAVDGQMSAATDGAIRSFQQKQGLSVDGQLGKQTEAAIKAMLASHSGPLVQTPELPTKKTPVFLGELPMAQPRPSPLSTGPVTSRRIYVVRTPEFQNLPLPTRKAARDELNAIFAFVPMAVLFVRPDLFPVGVNFSDAVVSVVATGASSHVNQALRTQISNALHSLANLGVRVQSSGAMSHRPSPPERVGLAGMNKQIIAAGSRRLALPLMAAAVSLEDLLDAFREDYTEGRIPQQIRLRRSGPLSASARYWASYQSLVDTLDLQHIALVKANPKEPRKWTVPIQELFGQTLARVIAHEARHLYIPKHAALGLGTGEPQLVGSPDFERFSDDDRRDILKMIRDWERKQGNATVVETFPITRRNLDFPF